ncbi:hypothetical protein Tco_0144323 [Tanacetum coccineum]
MEEMDLRWQMALLTMRAKRFLKTQKEAYVNGNETIGFDKSKVECYNCLKTWDIFVGVRKALRNQDNKNKERSRRSVSVEISTSTTLMSCDGLGGYDWSDQAEEGPNYALMAFLSSSPNSEMSLRQSENDDALIIEEWVSDSKEENGLQLNAKENLCLVLLR